MERAKTPNEGVAKTNRQMNAPEDADQKRRDAVLDTATRPSSGAPIPQALAGSEISGDRRADETSETAQSLKRAAENDGRV